jgi:hypothetical protein
MHGEEEKKRRGREGNDKRRRGIGADCFLLRDQLKSQLPFLTLTEFRRSRPES